MSRDSLRFGTSFEDIISIIPNLSHRDEEKFDENLSSDENLTDKNERNEKSEKKSFKKKANTSNQPNLFLISAIYNILAISIFSICLGLCFLLFTILQAFIRSILWSILTSAFLFPFKNYLTELTRTRLESIERNELTITFEFFLLPFKLVDSIVDYIWMFIKHKYRQILILVSSIIFFHLASSFYQSFFDFSKIFYSLISDLFTLITHYIDNSWQITCTLTLSYLLAVTFYWNEKYTTLFQLLSVPVWSSLFFLSTKLMGSYRPLFMIAFVFLICIGIYSIIKEYIINNIKKLFINIENENLNESDPNEEKKSLNEKKTLIESSPFKKRIIKVYHMLMTIDRNKHLTSDIRKKENSDLFFIALFWLFLCVKLRYDFYVAIPFFVLVWKILKLTFFFVYEIIFESDKIKIYYNIFKSWLIKRQTVLAPKPVLVLIKLFLKGDHKVNQILQKSIDSLISAILITSLILFLTVTIVILAMQVQSEIIQLIKIISNIFNENLYKKPELKDWLPEKEKLNNFYLSSMNNIYVYGRDWLLKSLKSSSSSLAINLNDQVKNKTDFLLMEAQLLEHWDNLYSYLTQREPNNLNFTKRTNSGSNESVNLNEIKNNSSEITRSKWNYWNLKIIASDSFNYKHILIILKDNFGVLISILETLYQLFKVYLFTIISAIFNSGFALMNFMFSCIVYLTAMFYLLSMSGSRFKPLTWLADINLIKNQNQIQSSKSEILSKAIEDSIRSVFVASLKMAVFFGIYTYLINCLFGVSIIYLPAIVAALFAFLPLIGTYWACIPGVLELWLIQENTLLSLLFVIIYILPYIFSVDRAIYSEINAGHPYLTGLAFAGGVYCLGLEGALIGPIVLCLIIVIGRIITSTTLNGNLKK